MCTNFLFLKTKKGPMPENHFPDSTWQAPEAQGILKRPLEAPKPHTCGELRCSKQSSRLPRRVPMPDCTSCCRRIRRRDSLSLTEVLHTRKTPRLSKKTKWLEPVAPSCLFPTAKVAGEARSFVMRDPVGSRLLVMILSLVAGTK